MIKRGERLGREQWDLEISNLVERVSRWLKNRQRAGRGGEEVVPGLQRRLGHLGLLASGVVNLKMQSKWLACLLLFPSPAFKVNRL